MRFRQGDAQTEDGVHRANGPVHGKCLEYPIKRLDWSGRARLPNHFHHAKTPPHRRAGKDKSLWKEITPISGSRPNSQVFHGIGSCRRPSYLTRLPGALHQVSSSSG